MKKWMKNLKEINGNKLPIDQYNLLHLKPKFSKNKDNLLQQIIELTKLFPKK